MIIQAELRRKQSEYEGEPCAVDKVIELPSPRFKQFSRALLADYDFIAENKNAIRHDDDARHCLLILDAEGMDGFLVDPQGHNYARYSAFVPNAHSLLTPDMGVDHSYEPGGNAPMELEASLFTDPATKNSADLAIYAANAWNSGWGYVWGTFGQVLTPELLQYKISQYPEGVGDEADFIRSHWLNRRTTDCVGLIKGYGWLNTVTMEIQYGSNGMPDVGADGMYYNAGRKGSIETMPDTPGLAVWKSGHIGVYIGNGEVIEAMDTRYGVVKTKLQGRGWTHWLEVPGIKYD